MEAQRAMSAPASIPARVKREGAMPRLGAEA